MMRIGSLLLMVCVAPFLLAQKEKEKKAEAKPNTLTAKEVADGWLLLFDGETTFGWKVDGEAKVKGGELVIAGGKNGARLTTTTALGYGKLIVEARGEGKGTVVRFHEAREKFAPLAEVWVRWTSVRDEISIASKYEQVGRVLKIDTLRTEPALKSAAPLHIDVPAGGKLAIRNVRFLPETTTKLFNGKDLTGWKAFKGNPKQEKSKFTVTKEGWLNVKDGAGDLQTEKTFADFVLQLECISNGTRLNSGVFFRCQPDKYQQGYEAQIHNGWLEKPKDITVADYDPMGKKAFKRNVKTTAMDFGTGAIYNRQPARRAVARDKEWFAMTVVARGRHFATWVNGIQQVDWTDHRPENDNARQGFRAKAGAISIQGHDPTTDLSFRNIRIGGLP